MSAKDLFLRVECYVGLRRALGYVVTSDLDEDSLSRLVTASFTRPVQ